MDMVVSMDQCNRMIDEALSDSKKKDNNISGFVMRLLGFGLVADVLGVLLFGFIFGYPAYGGMDGALSFTGFLLLMVIPFLLYFSISLSVIFGWPLLFWEPWRTPIYEWLLATVNITSTSISSLFFMLSMGVAVIAGTITGLAVWAVIGGARTKRRK